jgi:hypothetical protein
VVDEATTSTVTEPEDARTTERPKREFRRRPLVALIITVAVVIAVLGLLPATLASMIEELRGQGSDRIYDLFTGQEVDPNRTVGPDAAFVNITVTDLDEARLMATLTISGNRVCQAVCPPITGTFFSLGSDSARRRGLPPSADVNVPGETGAYTFTIELPIHGRPQLFPFDDYNLLLGLIVTTKLPSGREQNIDSQQLVQKTVSLTLEDQVARLNMTPPVPVDPATVRSPSDPTEFLLVDQLQWQRPRYLRILERIAEVVAV